MSTRGFLGFVANGRETITYVHYDAKTFEVYQGFQTRPHKGRFADRPANERSGYYPVKLLNSWPLDALPDDDAFLASDD
jgi:hypothetical protein